MVRVFRQWKIALAFNAFLVGTTAMVSTSAGPSLTSLAGITPEVIAPLVAPIIASSIPREFEGSKDWGKTRRVTTGMRSEGNFFRFDMHRKLQEVNDGVWKKYKLTLVEPDKNLTVRIDNFRTLESGKYALTLFVAAKVHGWSRAVVYERGVHLVSLEAEGDTSIRLWLDAEVGIESVDTSSLLPGVAVLPVVTDARLKFDEFRLNRISDVKGALAHDLGDLLRNSLEKELSGPKLAAKLNRSIQKHPERLRFTADKLLGKVAQKAK
jgi:hypothetical protein